MLCSNNGRKVNMCNTAPQKSFSLVNKDNFSNVYDTFFVANNEKDLNNTKVNYVSSNVKVENGKLKLFVTADDTKFNSGNIKSKATYGYGLYIVKFQCTKQKGSWPAIWMVNDSNWPIGGELDIMETQDLQPGFATTVHCGNKKSCTCYSISNPHCKVSPPLSWQEADCECTTQPGVPNIADGGINEYPGLSLDWFKDFHTVAWEWNADGVFVYVDVQVVNGKLVGMDGQPKPPGMCILKDIWYKTCPEFHDGMRVVMNISCPTYDNQRHKNYDNYSDMKVGNGAHMFLESFEVYKYNDKLLDEFPPPQHKVSSNTRKTFLIIAACLAGLIIILFLVLIFRYQTQKKKGKSTSK